MTTVTLTPEASEALTYLMENLNPKEQENPDQYVSETLTEMAAMWKANQR